MILTSLFLASGIYLSMAFLLTWSWQKQGNSPAFSEQPPISIIVSAHNEADNLPNLLADLCEQNYPNYELIIVLDRCSDNSASILAAWTTQYPHIRGVSVQTTPTGWASKKWALSQGIAEASHDWLALTDADCRMDSRWLTAIATHLHPQKEVLLGISPYPAYPGLLNKLIRFETWYTAFQYIGWTGLGLPYMGVGRNLVYRRSFFEDNHGFEAFRDRLSGDDDLLINAYATAGHTQSMIHPHTRTFSEPKRTWRDWYQQKTRHISASTAYSWKSKMVLAIFHLAHSWFYGGILLSLSLGLASPWIWWTYLARIGLSWVLFGLVNRQLKESNLLLLFPVLDLLFFLYNLSIVPIGIIKVPTWTN
ncbi:MAG: glycosyltransferase [Bacteroidota bacterium]